MKRRAPGAGRPPGEFGQKTATIGIRLTKAQRDAFDKAAAAGGRSMSQEMLWRAWSTFDMPSAPAHIHALGEAVKLVVEHVERATGLDWRSDRFTFEAVLAAVYYLLSRFGPPKPAGEAEVPERVKKIAADIPNAAAAGDYMMADRLGPLLTIGLEVEARNAEECPTEMSNPLDPAVRRQRLFRELLQRRQK
jgi:hypothetical protein